MTHSQKKKIKVAVLCGGISNERDVSLKSGAQVARALQEAGYRVSLVEICPKGAWLLKGKGLIVFDKGFGFEKSELKQFDAFFVALHGKFGEDGKVQAILDCIGIPYTGSGVLASALGMNKAKTNEIAATAGIKVPPSIVLSSLPSRHAAFERKVKKEVGYPCVVKPNESGSSVGITIVQKPHELLRALKTAFKEDNVVLVQKFIRGREIACGVMGNTGTTSRALPPVEVVPPKGRYFDYDAKYFSEETQEICPAPMPVALTKKVRELSKRAHAALGCDGLTRSDFILTPRGEFYFLEINTIPGLTEASLCPKEAKAAGMSFAEFMDRLVQLALLKK